MIKANPFLAAAFAMISLSGAAKADDDVRRSGFYVRGSIAASIFHRFDHDLIIDFDVITGP